MINQQILNSNFKQVYSSPLGELRFLLWGCNLTNHMILFFLLSGSYSTEKKRTKSLPPVFPITEVPTNSHLQSRKQTAFVQLGLLHPRSVFGLSTLLNFDDDFQLLQQASVSLVSRGAECVMISKKFFMNQASELTKKWIRHNVRSYPSRETLQRNLQERINWDAYKQDVIQTVIARWY